MDAIKLRISFQGILLLLLVLMPPKQIHPTTATAAAAWEHMQVAQTASAVAACNPDGNKTIIVMF